MAISTQGFSNWYVNVLKFRIKCRIICSRILLNIGNYQIKVHRFPFEISPSYTIERIEGVSFWSEFGWTDTIVVPIIPYYRRNVIATASISTIISSNPELPTRGGVAIQNGLSVSSESTSPHPSPSGSDYIEAGRLSGGTSILFIPKAWTVNITTFSWAWTYIRGSAMVFVLK